MNGRALANPAWRWSPRAAAEVFKKGWGRIILAVGEIEKAGRA